MVGLTQRVASVASLLSLALACTGCRACGKRASQVEAGASAANRLRRGLGADDSSANGARNAAMWAAARGGAVEDLASLSAQEGAAGLIEAAEDPDLRATALRAMATARGWAQLPYLAAVALGASDDDARMALDSVTDLAVRVRRSEDVEDVDELREGCEALGALARDRSRSLERRIRAARALRMMPCPQPQGSSDLDADERVDAG